VLTVLVAATGVEYVVVVAVGTGCVLYVVHAANVNDIASKTKSALMKFSPMN
jgi:hypothetical protein